MKLVRQNRRGFTLAEAMIAMVILAVATSAVILPFSTAGALTQESAKRTLAASLAADLLEEIQNTDLAMIDMLYDNIFEPAGTVRDANFQVFTDPVYGRFARLSTCSAADVGGESLIWATVYIYYNDIEIFQVSTLIGP
ncbi:MAG: prepilin-type N-terminal cleavage/methylation domain-containing protein [Planctomycetes bacterium]|nr:prepilin-type N-terminal cleavage/methylation domain-containing protein [Planctomycetota bacterium]